MSKIIIIMFFLVSTIFGEVVNSTVKGIVVDFDTNARLREAVVILENSGKPIFLTNSDGFFKITDIIPDTYRISIKMKGYIDYEGTVVVRPGSEDEIIFEMKKNAGKISGFIFSKDMTPLKDVKVTINDISAVTDENGVYLIEDVRPGTYSITVRHKEMVTAEKVVAIRPGEKTQANFILEKDSLRIVGKVLDKFNRTPIKDAFVVINDEKNSSVFTKEDGSYIFTDLRSGSYTIRVKAKNYNQTIELVDLVFPDDLVKDIYLDRN